MLPGTPPPPKADQGLRLRTGPATSSLIEPGLVHSALDRGSSPLYIPHRKKGVKMRPVELPWPEIIERAHQPNVFTTNLVGLTDVLFLPKWKSLPACFDSPGWSND